MSRSMGLILLLAALPAAPASAAMAAADRAACEVWQRELAFARSVQRHDAAAFAAFLADDSVFDANADTPVRGPQAIVRHWAAILAGKSVRLDWYPQHVVASADGTLATSSGPYLFENLGANAASRSWGVAKLAFFSLSHSVRMLVQVSLVTNSAPKRWSIWLISATRPSAWDVSWESLSFSGPLRVVPKPRTRSCCR